MIFPETSSTLELDVYILLRFPLTCKYAISQFAMYIYIYKYQYHKEYQPVDHLSGPNFAVLVKFAWGVDSLPIHMQ